MSRILLILATVCLLAVTPRAPARSQDMSAGESEHYHQSGQFPEELKDADGDGVSDMDDNCPQSSPGEKVDECGCPLPPPPPPPVVDPCSLDADQDGVNDCLDKCPNTHPGHIIGPDGCPLPIPNPIRLRLDVKFEFDRADILPGYVQDLLRARQLLLKFPDARLRLEGHADWLGKQSYNQPLSERRALAARDSILNGGGIHPSRVEAVGYGELRPIADNTTEEGRALNRRTTAELTVEHFIVPVNDQPPPLDGLRPETQAPAARP